MLFVLDHEAARLHFMVQEEFCTGSEISIDLMPGI